MTTDDTLTLWAAAYNIDDVYLGDTTVSWLSTGSIDAVSGDSSSSVTFYPSTARTSGAITATVGDITDQTGTITVTPGDTSYVRLLTSEYGDINDELGNHPMTTDNTLQLYSAGYDADDNFVANTVVDWTSGGTLSPVVTGRDTSYLYNPDDIGSGKIYAAWNSSPEDSTGTINVNPGVLSIIEIENAPLGFGIPIDSLHLTADDSIPLFIVGYDNDGVIVNIDSVSWIISNNLGTIISYGDSSIFYANIVGFGTIQVQSGSLTDIIPIKIQIGLLTIIEIQDILGNEVNDVTLTTDSSISLVLSGYDSDNNEYGYIIGDWSVSGTLNENTLSNTHDSLVLFNPSVSNTNGFIIASTNGVVDSTGMINVINPPIIQYVPGSLSPTTAVVGGLLELELDIINVGDVGVYLTDESTISIAIDAHNRYQIPIINTTFIPPDSSNIHIYFVQDTIPDYITPGYYTPIIDAIGYDVNNNNFSQSDISTSINSINLISLQINEISCSEEITWAGKDSIYVEMSIFNPSQSLVSIDQTNNAYLYFSSHSSDLSVSRIDSINSILPNQSTVLKFYIDSNTNATPGTIIINGAVIGRVDSTIIIAEEALNTDSISIISDPDIIYHPTSLKPMSATHNQLVPFSLEIHNIGDADVELSTSTHLVITNGLDTILTSLPFDVLIPGNGDTIELDFNSTIIPNTFIPNSYTINLLMAGNDIFNRSFISNIILQSDQFIIDSPIEFQKINNSTIPNVVIKDYYTNWKVDIINSGSATAYLRYDSCKFFLFADSVEIHSDLVGDNIIKSNVVTTIQFDSIYVRDYIPSGSYSPLIQLIGVDNNNMRFSQSIIADQITIKTNPIIKYNAGLTPSEVTPGENTVFSLLVDNIGESGVLIDTLTKLYFHDQDTNYFSTHLEINQSLSGNEQNVILNFKSTIIPTTMLIGEWVAYIDIWGYNELGHRYTQYHHPTSTVYIISKDGPAIVNVRFYDGGFNKIPNGKIDSTDLIKIKFNSSLRQDLLIGKNAKKYFQLISYEDQFGKTDSSIVINSGMAEYDNVDSDSSIFIELCNEAILATNCSDNRNRFENETVIMSNSSPTQIIIDPNISIGFLIDENGRDAGFPSNRANLTNQLEIMKKDTITSKYQSFNRFSILVDDNEPPILLDYYPNPENNSQRISKYTDISGLISGRNFIYLHYLDSLIEKHLGVDFNFGSENLPNAEALYDLLNNVLNGQYSENGSIFIENLKSYQINQTYQPLYTEITVNPLKRMYTNLTTFNYFFTENEESEIYISDHNSNIKYYSSVDDVIIDPLQFTTNLIIENVDPIDNEKYFGIELSTIIKNNQNELTFPININEQINDRSQNGYFLWSGPNPYIISKRTNISCTIEYEIPSNDDIIISIIDSAGRLVWKKKIVNSPKGKNSIYWNGTNHSGAAVSKGVYLMLLMADKREVKSSWLLAIN